MQPESLEGRALPHDAMKEVNEHPPDDSYDQGIQSYVKRGELCPCHGDHNMFTPTVSPAHWKCARNKAENDQMLRSVASVGSQSAETIGFEKIELVYGKMMADPRTKEYAKHLFAVLHNVKNNAYWLHIYCNGCRSYSRLMYVRAYDATQRSEAQEIANNIFQPYLDYFRGGKKGIDGRGTFSSQAPPQPSRCHVWSKDSRDCAWECWEKYIKRDGVDDDIQLTQPHLQLHMSSEPPASRSASDAGHSWVQPSEPPASSSASIDVDMEGKRPDNSDSADTTMLPGRWRQKKVKSGQA